MLDAFQGMGLKLNREDPMADMGGIRFMLRYEGVFPCPPRRRRPPT